MERRQEHRYPVALDVELYDRRLLGRYRTGNLSYSGLFVEAPWLELSRARVLDVVVHIGAESYPLKAAVMHHALGGLGLARIDANPGFARLLHRRFRHAGPATRQ